MPPFSNYFRSLVGGAKKLAIGDSGSSAPSAADLFPVTNPEVDGDDCSHDCDSCHVKYPRGFKIEEDDLLYGLVKGWNTHILVATGKADWVRDVEDEKGSVMQAIGRAEKPSNGKMMLSASNIPTPSHSSDYSEPTTILLLPAFTIVENVTPDSVPKLISEYINHAPTNVSPLGPVSLPKSISTGLPDAETLLARPSPHRALILLCSQKTRDARCGQSAPLLRKELERHLRPLGLFRDLDDERPGGVGIYFISHVGGHKYSANMMVYRRPDAFGVDDVERAKLASSGEQLQIRKPTNTSATKTTTTTTTTTSDPEKKVQEEAEALAEEGEKEGGGNSDASAVATMVDPDELGASQCIWLARVKPEDCENVVKYTVLQGKVVKPDTQLRGGFDRAKGLLSW